MLKIKEVNLVLQHNTGEEFGSEEYDADLARAIDSSKMMNDLSKATSEAEATKTSPITPSQLTHVSASGAELPIPPPPVAETDQLVELNGTASSPLQQSTKVDTFENTTKWQDCVTCGASQRDKVFPSFTKCIHEPQICANCYSRSVEAELMSDGPGGVECPDQQCERRIGANEAWQQFIPFGERDDNMWCPPNQASLSRLSTFAGLQDAGEKAEQINNALPNSTRETRKMLPPSSPEQQEQGICMSTIFPRSEPIVSDEKNIDIKRGMHYVDQLSFITAEDQGEFLDLFVSHVGLFSGRMSVCLIRDMLSQYALQEDAVAKICLLCDTQSSKRLSFSEFALSMYYGMRARRGKPLPDVLPGKLYDEVNQQNSNHVSPVVDESDKIQAQGLGAPLPNVSSAYPVLLQPQRHENMTTQHNELACLSSPRLQHTNIIEVRCKALQPTVEPSRIFATTSERAVDLNDPRIELRSQACERIASDPAVSSYAALEDTTSSSQSGPVLANQSLCSKRGRVSSMSSLDVPQEQPISTQLRHHHLHHKLRAPKTCWQTD
ncbi:hypothetical protein BKA63DRAFT_97827 [Paraphoma chrysanthemicola]|nr:hypothetical protein BKA63DRAFT_97827 [Paraphoma chrysanthemicola]